MMDYDNFETGDMQFFDIEYNDFDEVNNRTSFKKWFFGHWHDDLEIDEKYIMLYDIIRGLE